MCCDLEVDVNGEETFLVDKDVLTSFSGRLRKLFGKLKGSGKKLKVIFHDFPGGAEGFELIARFCYNNGRVDISPSYIFLLYCAANFMEMNKDTSNSNILNLVDQVEKYFNGINFWTWSDFLLGLKQCQNVLAFINSSPIFHEFLKFFVGKIALYTVSIPSTSSSNISSSDQSSFEINSDSIKNQCSRTTWWFEDLVFVNINLLEMVINAMLSHGLDHAMICSFLFHYQKLSSFGATPLEKCRIIETVINLLSMLDGKCISYRGLFHIFRVSFSMKLSNCCKSKLESLIGSRLDQATLDDLLVPPPRGHSYMYDVNLILRFQKSFLLKSSNEFFIYRLKKVSGLMDSYMSEVAPDSSLRPSKFVALVTALPDFGRDSYDQIYKAVDLYLEVHGDLCEEEKIQLCSSLNYEKLSPETLKYLAQNSKFPYNMAVTAILSRKSKLKSLLQDTVHLKTLIDSSSLHYNKFGNEVKNEDGEEILLYVNKLDVSTENEKQLSAHIQGMRWWWWN